MVSTTDICWKDKEANAMMQNAQQEAMMHFGMDFEFLLRKKAGLRITLQANLFTKGDIVEAGKKEEEKAE